MFEADSNIDRDDEILFLRQRGRSDPSLGGGLHVKRPVTFMASHTFAGVIAVPLSMASA